MITREGWFQYLPAVIPVREHLALERSDQCRTPTKHRIDVIEDGANNSLPKDRNIQEAVQRKEWRDDQDGEVEPSYASDSWKALRQGLNELHNEPQPPEKKDGGHARYQE